LNIDLNESKIEKYHAQIKVNDTEIAIKKIETKLVTETREAIIKDPKQEIKELKQEISGIEKRIEKKEDDIKEINGNKSKLFTNKLYNQSSYYYIYMIR